MKFSKSWIQQYIEEPLPTDEVIAREINAKAFEVEGIEEIGILVDENKEAMPRDSIFDIKVLPNRAHDALGHLGMAREWAAVLGLTFKNLNIPKTESDQSVSGVQVKVLDSKLCSRFMSARIDGVDINESPEWLSDNLRRMGQKSINNIVDITNYVQFTLNKPMHAYGAENIDGGIVVRFAEEGETLETLDDRELKLNAKTLVIADNKKSLGLAGIKGGKHSGINPNTKSIIIESANFNPSLIRKTSLKYDLRTDASKRFENGIANSLVEDGFWMTVNEIKKLFPEAKLGPVTDFYPVEDRDRWVGVTKKEIGDFLGKDFSQEQIESALKALQFKFEKIIPANYIKDNMQSVIGAQYKNPSSMSVDAPNYFSCSSLVSYLYKGVWMPSISIDKYVFSKKINKDELRFGDLVFSNSEEGRIYYETVEYLRGTKVEDGIDHVGIYVGDNNVLHATKRVGHVLIESLDDFAKMGKVIGFGRVCEDLEEERYVITPPSDRLDIRIKEDIVEEVGRIIGYSELTPKLPILGRKGLQNKKLHYQNIIRNILTDRGFAEVITYSFVKNGEVKLQKSASDKNRLRTNLSDGLLDAINKNIYNGPVLNMKDIAIFEFGNCFTSDREWTSLAIAIDDGKKKSNFAEQVDQILVEIKKSLGVVSLETSRTSAKPLIVEIDFDSLLSGLPEVNENQYLNETLHRDIRYKAFSQMPFIVRDVAFWVNGTANRDELQTLIIDNAGELCVSVHLFDEFVKDGKTSIGYRLVYQDKDRTLTDEEVNAYADKVYSALRDKGYEIR